MPRCVHLFQINFQRVKTLIIFSSNSIFRQYISEILTLALAACTYSYVTYNLALKQNRNDISVLSWQLQQPFIQ